MQNGWINYNENREKRNKSRRKNIEEDIEDPIVEVKEDGLYEKNSPDILKGISIKVPRNSLFAIVGGNGPGKSTTLKAISGIVNHIEER